jgi:hypothetical protein
MVCTLALAGGCAIETGSGDPTDEPLVDSSQEVRTRGFRILGPEGKIRGKTYERWSGEWWAWAHGIPASTNPLLDLTGEFCDEGQQGPVFYLAGTFGGSATRTCTVPHNKPLFFPLINLAVDNCGVPPADQLTEEELIELQEGFADGVTALTLTVDGTVVGDDKDELAPFLIDVTEFAYDVPDEDSLYDFFGLDFEGHCAPSFSAGYYVALSLERGSHTVQFSAANASGFSLDVTYNLTVR